MSRSTYFVSTAQTHRLMLFKEKPVLYCDKRSRDSSFGMATRIRAGPQRSWGSIHGRGKRFSLLHNIQTSIGSIQLLIRVLGAISRVVKRQGREAGAIPPPPIRVHDVVPIN
jgi:hypothetical protein